MRLSLGLFLSLLLHVGFLAYALFWASTTDVRVNMDRPVYTVDLLSLAPPPTPAPVVEAPTKEIPAEPQAPVVEATSEPVSEVKEAPVVEAKSEPKIEPKEEKISPKKVEKKVVKKKEEKPKPKPKPQKTAEQLKMEALAAAKATVKKQERKKQKALQDELAALKKEAGAKTYSHGGQDEGVEGGQQGGFKGGVGSGLSEVYALIVGTAIKKNWRYPTFAGEANLITTVEIVLDKEGKILSSKILAPSGNGEFDNSTLRAIRETEYVERPRTDRDRILRINFNSQELSE
ncbi:TonB family protein [Pseudodesulfovibrio sp. zrk46]|nr:TonB family protein [Pseudodesulfovibrio sp. zrk46]